MLDFACQVRVPLFGFGLLFVFFCVGVLLMPGKWSVQKEKFRLEWLDVRRKATAKSLSSPLFLLFGVPVVGLICLPVLAPPIAWSLGIGALVVPQLLCR